MDIEKLDKIDISDIRALILMANGMTQTEASKRLGVSQPGIVKRLRKFESAFGVSIGEGVRRSWRITEEGKEISRRFTPLYNYAIGKSAGEDQRKIDDAKAHLLSAIDKLDAL